MYIDKKTFCPLLFYGWDSRTRGPCCYFDKFYKNIDDMNQDIDTVRQASITGIKSAACNQCWQIEKSGITSHRQSHLHRDYLLVPQHKFDSMYTPIVENKQLQHLVIDTGKNCNFACRTCNHFSSTGWWKEHTHKTGEEINVKNNPTDPTLDYLLDYDLSHVERINVLGGEPFLDKTHLAILDRIEKSQCTIVYTTNGSIPLHKTLIDNLDKFNECSLLFSIDAVEQQFDYIRTNGDWQQVSENIYNIKKLLPNAKIGFSTVISALNVLYIDRAIKWMQDNFDAPNIHIKPALWQPYYTMNIFTAEEKQKIVQHLYGKPLLESTISLVQQSTFDAEARKQFFREIEWTKQYKGLDAANYLPELVDLMKQ